MDHNSVSLPPIQAAWDNRERDHRAPSDHPLPPRGAPPSTQQVQQGQRSGASSPANSNFLPTPSGSPPPPPGQQQQDHPHHQPAQGAKLSHLLHDPPQHHSQHDQQQQPYGNYGQPSYPQYQGSYGLAGIPPSQQHHNSHFRPNQIPQQQPMSYGSYHRFPPIPGGNPGPPGSNGYQNLPPPQAGGPSSRSGTPNSLPPPSLPGQGPPGGGPARFGYPAPGARVAGQGMSLPPLSLPPGNGGGPLDHHPQHHVPPQHHWGPLPGQQGSTNPYHNNPLGQSTAGGGGEKRQRDWDVNDDTVSSKDEDEEDDSWRDRHQQQPGPSSAPPPPAPGQKSKTKHPKVVRQSLEELASGVPPVPPKPPIKKFVCPHAACGRAFARNFNLQSHIKSHMGVRDFKCPECPKSFSRRHDCARHCIAVHHYDKETGKKRVAEG